MTPKFGWDYAFQRFMQGAGVVLGLIFIVSHGVDSLVGSNQVPDWWNTSGVAWLAFAKASGIAADRIEERAR